MFRKVIGYRWPLQCNISVKPQVCCTWKAIEAIVHGAVGLTGNFSLFLSSTELEQLLLNEREREHFNKTPVNERQERSPSPIRIGFFVILMRVLISFRC